MVSKRQQAVEILKNGNLTDKDLARALGVSVNYAQVIISGINRSQGKKFSSFFVLRSGSKDNYVRELVDRNSNENKGLLTMERVGVEGLKKLSTRRKAGSILINTRQGQSNRMRLMHNILQQNLKFSIEAQKLLQ